MTVGQVDDAKILVVDDTPANIKLLDAVLTPKGYRVCTASGGREALAVVVAQRPDLVLLDIRMPEMDGYEVCRRLRVDPATSFLPVVMITASGAAEKVKALEVGADDFITKPFDQSELLARVQSLLRIKRYHDLVQEQAEALAAWNATLEARVAAQVGELERLSRLRRFLSPQLADVVSADAADLLRSHRREVAVLFCDLRGFTAFSEAADPDQVMAALAEFHAVAGRLVNNFGATVGFFAGDGLMVFFNDPVPCAEPAARAVHMAVALREAMVEVVDRWSDLGYDLGYGIGIAYGAATLGEVGFEGRSDYSVFGTVPNLAARLCDRARPGEILIAPNVAAELDDAVHCEPQPEVALKGFRRPVAPHSVLGLRARFP